MSYHIILQHLFYAIYLNYLKNYLHFSQHFSSIAVVVFAIYLIHICLFQFFPAATQALALVLAQVRKTEKSQDGHKREYPDENEESRCRCYT